jgi:outer membrane protein assembly factor BamB
MRFARLICAALSMVVLCGALAAAATPSVTLTPNIDPPSTSIGPPTVFQVSGSGFPDSIAVNIYFDTTDVALAVTTSTGTFSGINVDVPATAVPGTHWVTAVAEGTSGTAAQASFTVQTNYTQFHYSPLHRGRNPYENVLNSSNVGAIDQDWVYTTGGAITSSPAVYSIAVSGGYVSYVYVGSADDYLYCINATTGQKVWSYKTGNSIVNSSPAVALGSNGTAYVYVGSTDGYLYEINATTGALVWKFKTGAAIYSSPAVVNGEVYIGSTDESVYAVTAGTTTATQTWKYATTGAVYSSPAVSNGIVYIGSDDDYLYAINATTGVLSWKYKTGNEVLSSPTVSDGIVYVGSNDDNVYGLQAATGAFVWQFTGSSGAQFQASPAVFNGVVYIGSNVGYIYALTARNGTQIWDLVSSVTATTSSITFANGLEYLGVGSKVYATEEIVTPVILWTGTFGNSITSTPTVANGQVFIASQDFNLYAYDLNGSTQVKSVPERPDPKALRPDPALLPIWAQ